MASKRLAHAVCSACLWTTLAIQARSRAEVLVVVVVVVVTRREHILESCCGSRAVLVFHVHAHAFLSDAATFLCLFSHFPFLDALSLSLTLPTWKVAERSVEYSMKTLVNTSLMGRTCKRAEGESWPLVRPTVCLLYACTKPSSRRHPEE